MYNYDFQVKVFIRVERDIQVTVKSLPKITFRKSFIINF